MQLHSYKSCIFKTMLKCSMSKQPRQKVIYTLKLVLNFKIFKRQSICMFQVLKCILKVQAELSQPLSHLPHFISSNKLSLRLIYCYSCKYFGICKPMIDIHFFIPFFTQSSMLYALLCIPLLSFYQYILEMFSYQ